MDGEPPPPTKPLSVILLEHGIYVYGRSLKFSRPRGFRTLSWWGSERIELENGYSINPNIVGGEFIDDIKPQKINWVTSKLLWSLRRGLGAGFYHRPFFRNKIVWSIFTRLLDRLLPHPYPDLSQAPVEKYPLQINVDCDVLIVGSGVSGLKVAEQLSRKNISIVILEGDRFGVGGFASLLDKYSGMISKLLARLRRRGVKILKGVVFQGFLEDASIAYKYDTEQTILIKYDKLVLATGAYEIPPLIENNDLPMIIPVSTLLTLVKKYGYNGLKKGVVIAGMGDLQHIIETLGNYGIKPIITMRGRAPSHVRELAADRDIELIEEAERIVALGRERVSEIKIYLRGGERVDIKSDFLAYTPLVAPDKEVTAQLGVPYAFDTRLGGYIPIHSIYGELPLDDREIYLVGGAGGYIHIEAIEKVGEAVGKYILSSIGGGEDDYTDLMDEALAILKARYRDTYDALMALHDAYSRGRPYEYVGWDVPPTFFDGDSSKIFVCPDLDVLLDDIIHAYRDLGMWRMEHIKRYTGLGTGVCQGRDCQLNAAIVINQLSGKGFLEIGRFRARFPTVPQTLLSLGGVEVET